MEENLTRYTSYKLEKNKYDFRNATVTLNTNNIKFIDDDPSINFNCNGVRVNHSIAEFKYEEKISNNTYRLIPKNKQDEVMRLSQKYDSTLAFMLDRYTDNESDKIERLKRLNIIVTIPYL